MKVNSVLIIPHTTHAVGRGVIRQFLDWRATTAPVSAYRARPALSAAWSYCYQRDIVTTKNPCLGVSRNIETPRTRLVTDTEYKAVYDIASTRY